MTRALIRLLVPHHSLTRKAHRKVGLFCLWFLWVSDPRTTPVGTVLVGAVRGREGVGSVTTALNTYPTSHHPRQANAAHLQLRLQFLEIKEAKPTMDTSLFQTIKLIIIWATSLSKDALHIHVVMTFYSTFIAFMRRNHFYVS